MLLSFVQGSKLRQVRIEGRQVSLLTSETGFVPLVLNLDKLDDEETKKKIKKANLDEKEIIEFSKLKTEEEIRKDICKDFRKTGWRLVKTEE